MLLKTKEVHALQRPSGQDYRSVRNWFAAVKPLEPEEAQFIQRKEDIVALRTGREAAGFDSFVECCLSGTDNLLHKWFNARAVQVGQLVRYR